MTEKDKKRTRAKTKIKPHDKLRNILEEYGFQEGTDFVEEHRFHPVRRWRFDFAFLKYKVALEVEGGVFIGGRHTRPIGFSKDCEKYNHALLAGWRVLRFTPDMINKGEAIVQTLQLLEKDDVFCTVEDKIWQSVQAD